MSENRKERILDAMERVALDCPGLVFGFEEGTWFAVGPIGDCKINDYYCPPHPRPAQMFPSEESK